MRNFVKHTIIDRLSGKRPGRARAVGTALAVGGGSAAVTYRLLRKQDGKK